MVECMSHRSSSSIAVTTRDVSLCYFPHQGIEEGLTLCVEVPAGFPPGICLLDLAGATATSTTFVKDVAGSFRTSITLGDKLPGDCSNMDAFAHRGWQLAMAG